MAKRYRITDPATGQVYNTTAESPDEAKAKIETYIKANPVGGAPAAPDAAPEQQYDEKSTMQSIFDLIDPKTGKSIFYGNTPDPGPTEDYRRIARDTITRGFGDKALGPEAVAKTEAARERTPGYIEAPLDLASAVAASPYTVGSPMIGAAFGAGEGALRSYGNQEGWAPEWGNIARDAKTGAMLGGAGYALPSAWNAVKSGLQKVGSIPKTTTAIADYFTSGMPIATGASTAAKVGSAVMPKSPTNDVFRDILSKYMMGMGAN